MARDTSDPATVIGILGLGRMGSPIARALSRAGSVVIAFDPDAERLRSGTHGGGGLAGGGPTAAGSIVEVVRRADVLLTILPGFAELAALLTDGSVVPDSLPPGALWIDLTSTAPAVLRDAAAASAAAGVDFVAAPMRGSVDDAESATLRFWGAGSPTALERARPVLETLGGASAVTRVGDRPEDAAAIKLLSNLLWFGQVVATTEALLLGKALGLDPALAARLLADGPGGSVYLSEHVDSLLGGDYLTSFSVDRVVEELAILEDDADRLGSPFELSGLVVELHRRAQARFGPDDGELSAARLLEEMAGDELRRVAGSRAASELP